MAGDQETMMAKMPLTVINKIQSARLGLKSAVYKDALYDRLIKIKPIFKITKVEKTKVRKSASGIFKSTACIKSVVNTANTIKPCISAQITRLRSISGLFGLRGGFFIASFSTCSASNTMEHAGLMIISKNTI